MTDRELLELAAKAAGMNHLTEWSDFILDYDSAHYGGPALHAAGVAGERQSFNSLTYEGDAFRLMTYFGMHVFADTKGCNVNDIIYVDAADCDGDYMRAFCLAITRAAAEIGSAMG